MSRFIGMVIVAAIVALALWACDSAMQAPVPAGSPPDDRANVLRFDVQAPFGTLDPTVVSASGSNNVFSAIVQLSVRSRQGWNPRAGPGDSVGLRCGAADMDHCAQAGCKVP